ncbi:MULTISPECIES: LiaF transmembrane domain-containing protein [unclassified Paenibacillus]|uniref:LiaF transmembrane domain-containing protein n=1 Tax=unclassified Paenibacillus TaxID=185978 RepID=UPI002F429223
MNGKTAVGTLLIAIGALAVLNLLGIKLGAIIGMFMPVIMIGLGILGWANQKKVIGGILIVLGSLMLLAKLSGLFMWIIAIGLVVAGYSVIKNNGRRTYR